VRKFDDVQIAIGAYHGDATAEHHRYRSWEHCYNYFRSVGDKNLPSVQDQAALQLAFYLASWGMYRGSSFLLQYAYTVHRGVIAVLARSEYADLWEVEVGKVAILPQQRELILDLVQQIREAYEPFAPGGTSAQPTETLISKILLGTLGCVPAVDRYFIAGFKGRGFAFSAINGPFLGRLSDFCQMHFRQLNRVQDRILHTSGVRYPVMKLVDMYFWQLGYELDGGV